MQGFLITLSGARREILDQCPTERIKFQSLGWAILITSAMATISMWFALTSALGLSPILSLPAALAWGLIIMGIDRWLVTSIPTTGNRRRVALAMPRIVLAVLLGTVISTPLVLRIFQSEINAQISVIKEQRAAAYLTSLDHSSVGNQVATAQKRLASLQKVIDSHGAVAINPANDPVVRSLTKQQQAEQKLEQKYYKQWQCQLYGGPTCPAKGNGILAQASERAYKNAAAQVAALGTRIQAREATISATSASADKLRVSQARSQLPEARQQLAVAQARLSQLRQNFDTTNESTNGLLIRLQALSKLTASNFTLGAARFLLFLLFLVIECLPVTVKLLQRPGNYEEILRVAAERELKDARRRYRTGSPGAAGFAGSAGSAGSTAQFGNFDPVAPKTVKSLNEIWQDPMPTKAFERSAETVSTPPIEEPTESASYDETAIRGMQDRRGNTASVAGIDLNWSDGESSRRILLGRYDLLSTLGFGGMGSVWLAHDLTLDRKVALKELLQRSNSLDLSERRTRVLREARAMARVEHPSIVKIYDIFLDDQDDPWIVMEYIRGRSLASRIEDKPLDEATAASIGLPVLEGLRAAHRAGVMHRDIKPANILVADDDAIFLVDFGIAKIAGDAGLTDQSKILGTIEFMSPERLLGQPLTSASDLWSLGVTFFCALEGYSPFVLGRGRNAESIIAAILSNDPPPLSRPGPLADIVRRLLDRDPARRPSGAELASVLRSVAGPASVRASIDEPVTQTAEPIRAGLRIGNSTVIASPDRNGRAQAMNAGAQAARVMGMSQENAARHLAECPPRVAAEILELIASGEPGTAAAIIQMISLKGASRTVNHLPADTGAAILAAMPPSAAALIMNLADARVSGGILMALPPTAASSLLGAMDEPQAAIVLGYVEPATAAGLLSTHDDPSRRLLTRLSPSVRAQVIRHMRGRLP